MGLEVFIVIIVIVVAVVVLSLSPVAHGPPSWVLPTSSRRSPFDVWKSLMIR